MKNRFLSFLGILCLSVLCSCGSLNKAEGQLHYNNTVTKGQELLDLKKALNEEAINQEEYDLMKDRIINDAYMKNFFRQLDEMEEDEYDSVSI